MMNGMKKCLRRLLKTATYSSMLWGRFISIALGLLLRVYRRRRTNDAARHPGDGGGDAADEVDDGVEDRRRHIDDVAGVKLDVVVEAAAVENLVKVDVAHGRLLAALALT